MNNFTQRSLTGSLLIAFVVTCILSGRHGFIFLLVLINTLGIFEFYRLFKSEAGNPIILPGSLLSVSLLLTISLVAAGMTGWRIILINIPLSFIVYIKALYSSEQKPFHAIALTFMGIFYITIPLSLLACTAFLPFGDGIYHPMIVLGYFFIVWASDSGAYATGKLIGRNPLFKRISPNKTREGSIGGAISAILMAVIFSQFNSDLNLRGWIIMALVVIIFGTFGDLFKSMLKRSMNIKDSGRILPGHGGILDRFDSTLGAAPFVFIYLSVLL